MSKIINIPGLFLCFVVLVLPLTGASANKIDYQIYLDGRKLDMGQKAIKVSEFAPMVINLSNSGNKIRKLKVTLARGNRAVDTKKISGNQINLASFKSVARPGDRLVFEIFTAKKNRSQNQPLLVIAIPVV